jgi:HTH-type transcriptional regulator / antitoxin HigA
MANNEFEKEFFPTIAIPPGDSIRENMNSLGMDQEELAARLGITTKHLSNVLNGNSPVTYETALKLETVIGGSAQFWMNLEINYQLDKSRLEQDSKIYRELEIMEGIPYLEMSNYGWVEKSKDKITQVHESREYFGVANLELIVPIYQLSLKKQRNKTKIFDLSVLAWLRKAELEGLKESVKDFNKSKLKKLIPRLTEIIKAEPESCLEKVKELCASVGIALVILDDLPNTNINGATIWRKKRVILALNKLDGINDKLWNSFYIELSKMLD